MLRPADERDISEFEMRDKKWNRRVRLQQVLAARRPFWISGWILGPTMLSAACDEPCDLAFSFWLAGGPAHHSY